MGIKSISLAAFALVASTCANAALTERLGGLAYYDDVADLTWLADANAAQTSGFDSDGRMTWADANAWASGLEVAGITGWRLPSSLDPDGSGPCGPAFDCTDSEMANLFFAVLGGSIHTSITTTHNTNYDLFSNVQNGYYWSATENVNNTSFAWGFSMFYSGQRSGPKTDTRFAWAVHSGDVGMVTEVDPGFANLGEPLPNITAEQRAEYDAGLVIFKKRFTHDIGGGPLRNLPAAPSNTCIGCHTQVYDPGTETVSALKNGGGSFVPVAQVTAWNEETGTCDHLVDLGGPGFQKHSFWPDDPSNPLPPMLSPQDRADAVELAEYVPEFSSQGIKTGPIDIRITNDIYGLGLVDAVDDMTFNNLADPEDADGNGVSGRVHFVLDHQGVLTAGKFGRKAEIARLDDFNAEALLNEQGVTTTGLTNEGVVITGKVVSPVDGSTTYTTMALENLLTGDVQGVELSDEDFKALNTYTRLLAPGKDGNSLLTRSALNQGQKLFSQVGCSDCHTKSMRTGPNEIEALNNVVFSPYSDFLLHDMGSNLAEGCKGNASPQEWRTEPLWSMRFTAFSRFLHDGRAISIADAIKQHALPDPEEASTEAECPITPFTSDSEASNSVNAYCALSDSDKTILLNFLNTL